MYNQQEATQNFIQAINQSPMYWLVSDSSISLGDESGERRIIWAENEHYKGEVELESGRIMSDSEFDERILNFFSHVKNKLCKELESSFNILIDTGFKFLATGDSGDMIHIHCTDSHLYLSVFNSGQY